MSQSNESSVMMRFWVCEIWMPVWPLIKDRPWLRMRKKKDHQKEEEEEEE